MLMVNVSDRVEEEEEAQNLPLIEHVLVLLALLTAAGSGVGLVLDPIHGVCFGGCCLICVVGQCDTNYLTICWTHV